MTSQEPLLELAGVLGLPDEFRAEVEAAATAPVDYWKQHQGWLGVDRPVTNLGWLVLWRQLEEIGRLVVLDWREFPAEAVRALNRLWRKVGSPPRDAWAWVRPEMSDGTMPLGVFLDRAGREIRARGRAELVALDTGAGDDFALAILEPRAAARAEKLAQAAGYFLGRAFSARPPPRVAFEPLTLPSAPSTSAFVASTRAKAWEAIEVASLPIAEVPERFRFSFLRRRVLAYASVRAWDRNEAPKTLSTRPRFNSFSFQRREGIWRKLGSSVWVACEQKLAQRLRRAVEAVTPAKSPNEP